MTEQLQEDDPFRYGWRSSFADHELNGLHNAAFGSGDVEEETPWRAQVERWSLGWVTARNARDELVGFVNVAWDGARHAFLLDTAVLPAAQRRGVARNLVAVARREAARNGCEWLHVDFEERIKPFYIGACGFEATAAGILRLN